MFSLRTLFLLVASALSGCAQIGPPAGSAGASPAGTPALLVQPSNAARQELHTAVARMMGVDSVAVASDALLYTSLMVIEKNRPRGADGVQLSGRDYDKPEQFRLIKLNQECALVKLRTGAREVLRECQCIAEP